MKKILLASLLSLTIFCNGCAFSVPWWMFLKNEPTTTQKPLYATERGKSSEQEKSAVAPKRAIAQRESSDSSSQ